MTAPAWHGGMEAVLELPGWQAVLEQNPNNYDRFLSMDRLAFVGVTERWMMAYYPCDDTRFVPGLDDVDVARLNLPILVFRSGSTDISHPRATSERLAASAMRSARPDQQRAKKENKTLGIRDLTCYYAKRYCTSVY